MTGVEEGIAIAGLVGGTGLQIAGQIKGAQAQAEATREEATIKNMQATELLQREDINEGIIRENSNREALDYGAAFAAGGGEGAGIGGRLYLQKQTEQLVANSRRDAQFKAQMLQMGAGMDQKLASDTLTAGYIGAGSSLLSGVTKGYMDFGRPGRATALPGGA